MYNQAFIPEPEQEYLENAFAGVNNMPGTAQGSEIADAMEQKREIMKRFRGP